MNPSDPTGSEENRETKEKIGRGKKAATKKTLSTLIRKDSKMKDGPPRWRHFLSQIRKMRASLSAPVDVMGCTRLADRANSSPVSF